MDKGMIDDKTFESIKSRLKKIQSLAENGYKGEAAAARRLLDEMCKKYGLTIEDLLDQDKVERRMFNIGRNKVYLNLFAQCYAKVTGNKGVSYCKESSSVISLEVTAYQYAEILNLFDWHKANLKKDLDNAQDLCFEAYIQKHGLYRQRSEEEKREDKTPIDFERLSKIIMMMRNLNDNSYYKQLEQNEK